MVVSARGLPGRNCAVENTPGGRAEEEWGGRRRRVCVCVLSGGRFNMCAC